MSIYFKDNFFNAGLTDVLNESGHKIAQVDLRSAFGSALDICDMQGNILFQGKFPMFSRKWSVRGPNGDECGELRQRFTFMSKRFEYDSLGRGVYEITSPAFSSEYEITELKSGLQTAVFKRVSGWLFPSAYRLEIHSGEVGELEWVSVILGMNAIIKRNQNNNSTPPPS